MNKCQECKKWGFEYLIYGRCLHCSGYRKEPREPFITELFTYLKNQVTMKKVIGILLMIFGIAVFCLFVNWGKHYASDSREGWGFGIWFFSVILFGSGFGTFFFLKDNK